MSAVRLVQIEPTRWRVEQRLFSCHLYEEWRYLGEIAQCGAGGYRAYIARCHSAGVFELVSDNVPFSQADDAVRKVVGGC